MAKHVTLASQGTPGPWQHSTASAAGASAGWAGVRPEGRREARISCVSRILNLVYMEVVPFWGPDSGQKTRHTQRRRNRMSCLCVSVFVPGKWARFGSRKWPLCVWVVFVGLAVVVASVLLLWLLLVLVVVVAVVVVVVLLVIIVVSARLSLS